MKRIRYFDHSATNKVKEEVLKEMIPYFGMEYGNPSSMYSLGRKAKHVKEEARRKGAPHCWECKNWPCGGDPAYCGSFVKR